MELVGLIGGIVGAIGAVVAAIFAGIGNKHSKDSAESAESSNGIAKDALAKASESNGIAQQANQLSEMANSIAQREFARNTEHVVIDLIPVWDEHQNALVVTNHGTDTAKELVARIDGEGLTPIAQTHPDVPGGEQFLIPIPEIPKLRKDWLDSIHAVRARSGSLGVHVFGTFKVTLAVRLYFLTEAGNSQGGELTDVIAR